MDVAVGWRSQQRMTTPSVRSGRAWVTIGRRLFPLVEPVIVLLYFLRGVQSPKGNKEHKMRHLLELAVSWGLIVLVPLMVRWVSGRVFELGFRVFGTFEVVIASRKSFLRWRDVSSEGWVPFPPIMFSQRTQINRTSRLVSEALW